MANTYRTSQGDMWDSISYKMYGSENYADQLIESNTAYRNVTLFPGNITLTIPDIDSSVESANNSPPWRK